MVSKSVDHRIPHWAIASNHRRLPKRNPDIFHNEPPHLEMSYVEIRRSAHTDSVVAKT